MYVKLYNLFFVECVDGKSSYFCAIILNMFITELCYMSFLLD